MPHPEATENRRLGSRWFTSVRETYTIEQDAVRLADRRQAVDALVGSGAIAHWYAPFVHTEIAGELAKLRSADEQAILSFARTYGEMGFDRLHIDMDDMAAREKAGKRIFVGDPLPWLRAHASGVAFCLEVTQALASGRKAAAVVSSVLRGFDGVVYGEGAEVVRLSVDDSRRYYTQLGRNEMTLTDAARLLRADIVNPNLGGIRRCVVVGGAKGKDQSFFRWRAPIDAVYWHLANMIDGGIAKRCEADGCGGIFIQTDPRQRYCPKQWRQRESACATRQRQREARR